MRFRKDSRREWKLKSEYLRWAKEQYLVFSVVDWIITEFHEEKMTGEWPISGLAIVGFKSLYKK